MCGCDPDLVYGTDASGGPYPGFARWPMLWWHAGKTGTTATYKSVPSRAVPGAQTVFRGELYAML